MPIRSAKAVWEGSIGQGNGKMMMASGAYEGPFSVGSRFNDEAGTNPEELIAAAHAGCFSMSLSSGLTQNGTPPTKSALKPKCISRSWMRAGELPK